jgi:uncharacterized protein (TIGR03083 family)
MQASFDRGFHLDRLRREGDALLHAAGADPAADVPTCPGWSVTDLVEHVGGIYRYVARQARTAEQVPEQPSPARDPLAATADALSELLIVLAETDPSAQAWNWDRNSPNVAAFWPRRMALETVVHRFDAQFATGAPPPTPIDAELACDGIDEALTRFVARRRGRSKEGITGTVHLHATDAPPTIPAEWTVEFGPAGSTVVRHVHAKADAALRGPAGDLLLAVWGRPATLDRFGDESLIAAVRAQ